MKRDTYMELTWGWLARPICTNIDTHIPQPRLWARYVPREEASRHSLIYISLQRLSKRPSHGLRTVWHNSCDLDYST
eukprot:11833521-Karenia_brevis.AAC.1